MYFHQILEKVAEFQDATDQTVNKETSLISTKEANLRYELMAEENKEYFTACISKDKVEILDACVDMLYILAGTINSHGLQDLIEPAFELVHQNNMTKVGPDGKVLRDPNGKILKPQGFQPVNLKQLFKDE